MDCAGLLAGFGGVSILYQEQVRKFRYIKGKTNVMTTSADDTFYFVFVASKKAQLFSGVKLCQLFHLEQPYSQSFSTYHP